MIHPAVTLSGIQYVEESISALAVRLETIADVQPSAGRSTQTRLRSQVHIAIAEDPGVTILAKGRIDQDKNQKSDYCEQDKLLKGAGKGCQIFPFIDDDGFKLFVGFPCKTAFVYDRIYLNGSDEMMKFTRPNFEIKAEMLNGKQWEYSILSFVPKDTLGLSSVYFRQDGSFTKEDYFLTDNESIASNAMSFIFSMKQIILERIAVFDAKGV